MGGRNERQRLTVEDFRNPLFDKQRIRKRKIEDLGDEWSGDGELGEQGRWVIEGVIFTDGYNEVGFTCDLDRGEVVVKNQQNEVLFSGRINSAEDFEKALKKADRKQMRLWGLT